jgi:hypothetical protein
MNRIRRHVSYANVVATLALLFAMSGGALAAKHYLINSTKQINPKVLKKLTGKKGHTGLQGPTGLQGATGPQGAAGPRGLQGTSGATGSTGISGYEIVTGEPAKGSGGGADLASATAFCPEGKKAIGGGFTSSGPEDFELFVKADQPLGSTAWLAQTTSGTSTSKYEITAYAVCAIVTS